VVDKPAGMTSHDVVGLLRRRLGERRIGHSGTLDPDATGVLLCGVGNLTRFLRYLTDLPKTYTAEVVLGATTNTLDDSGEVTATFDMTGVTLEHARQLVAAHLTGPIMQIPPMVSAVRIDGKRLHELAREGIEVDREARPVTVYRYDVFQTDDPMVFAIEVQCSSGTYIRTLAADLGELLGGGAHVRKLRRTAIGSFTVAEAAAPDECEVWPMARGLRDYAAVTVDEDQARMVRHGRSLPRFDGEGPWVVCDVEGQLLAMFEANGEEAKPAVVVPELS
jgi:tRNA pseudouridine55 synthase